MIKSISITTASTITFSTLTWFIRGKAYEEEVALLAKDLFQAASWCASSMPEISPRWFIAAGAVGFTCLAITYYLSSKLDAALEEIEFYPLKCAFIPKPLTEVEGAGVFYDTTHSPGEPVTATSLVPSTLVAASTPTNLPPPPIVDYFEPDVSPFDDSSRICDLSGVAPPTYFDEEA